MDSAGLCQCGCGQPAPIAKRTHVGTTRAAVIDVVRS
jgi:hypothetical protein